MAEETVHAMPVDDVRIRHADGDPNTVLLSFYQGDEVRHFTMSLDLFTRTADQMVSGAKFLAEQEPTGGWS
ncbi:hypothetical protein [Tranquillimonas alkanivorans]|uniref:Uncharacterized protein n=1 Tax=Tranquillimonas alkanivorans TaxID=441119 RepID=A0A1I5RWY5_9RHOB|nr:hypothetical protein [Tranquillimonas alkanivorans]SFP62944.1 hypothetical protein SAMN04488047_109131 [Tranquillimonas alkanivorans]